MAQKSFDQAITGGSEHLKLFICLVRGQLQNSSKSVSLLHKFYYRFFATEFVTSTIDFILFVVEFLTFAGEFVSLLNKIGSCSEHKT